MPAATRSSASGRSKSTARSTTRTGTSSRASSASGKKGPAKKAPAKRSSTSTTRRSASKQPSVMAGVFERHAVDIVGIGAIVLGLLVALAVWAHMAGPVGDAVEVGARAMFGRGAFWIPVVAVVGGLLLVTARVPQRGAQRLIGAVIAAWGFLILTHLLSGAPAIDAPLPEIARAGGWIGAALAVPLQGAIGTAGAAVVAVGMVGVGLLVLTGQTVRSVASALASLFRAAVIPAEIDVTDPATPKQKASAATKPATAPQATEPKPRRRTRNAAGDEPGAEAGSPAIELFDQGEDTSPTAAPAAPPADAAAPDAAPKPAKKAVAPAATGQKPTQLELSVPKPPDADLYTLPSASILRKSTARRIDRAALEERGRVIAETLAEFKVGAQLVGIVAGPTVTRFEIELDQGVKVNQLTKLAPDLCYALATPDVRILAPIPGRSAIGLEVPNTVRQLVTVGDILTSPEAKAATNPLEVALGRDIAGRPVLVDLAKMPHLLIAGATGSGKSSCINSILTSLLCRTRPSEVRMILIDPKRVELGRYGHVPHLLTGVVTNPKRAAEALEWTVQEMERRLEMLSQLGRRDAASFNEAVMRGELVGADGTPYDRLPYIVVVVDELADLMLVAARNVEDSICRIAQMARAVGIHLVIATQRPSVDVITGVIKANIPSRMAFKVRTVTDSRVILDSGGAEKLVGQGDLLYLGANAMSTDRIQTCFVTEGEVEGIVNHWRDQMRRIAEAQPPPVPAAPAPGAADAQMATPTSAAADADVAPAVAPMFTPAPGPGTAGADHGVAAAPVALAGAAGGAALAQASPAGAVAEPDVVFSGDLAVRSKDDDDDSDDLLGEAMELVVRSQLGSTSMLQRKLRVGFSRAGRIMDLLERKGVVGPSEGSKARTVLISPDELEAAKARLGL